MNNFINYLNQIQGGGTISPQSSIFDAIGDYRKSRREIGAPQVDPMSFAQAGFSGYKDMSQPDWGYMGMVNQPQSQRHLQRPTMSGPMSYLLNLYNMI